MPLLSDFGFCGPSYAGPYASGGNLGMSQVFDSERCINYYPEFARGGKPKTNAELVGRPGLALWGTLPQSPVRGLWAGDQRLFAVGGTHLYEMNSNGSVKTDFGAMAGSLGGQPPCKIIGNGTQLAVMDPTVNNGGQLPGGIFVSGGGPPMSPAFAGSALTYLDGYFLSINSGPGVINQVWASSLGSGAGDATTWPGLNFIQRTGSSDLVLQLETINGQLWIFGTKTIEVWFDAQLTAFPLQRLPGATLNIGLLCRFSVVKYYNTLVWIGSDDQGYATVYMANGLAPQKISNPGVEYLLANYAGNYADTTAAICYGYREAGHTFYCINLRDAVNHTGQTGLTLVYDLDEGQWSERTFNKGGGLAGMFLPQTVASEAAFGGTGDFVFAGDWNSGKIYLQSLTNTSDNGTAIEYIRRAPHVSQGNQWIFYSSLEIDADIGTAQMQLDYSNDGGRTFPTAHRRGPQAASTTQAYGSSGGGFGRFKFWQLGRSRDRVFQSRILDATNRIRLIGANLFGRPGNAAATGQP
jgi:hypothetical protein